MLSYFRSYAPVAHELVQKIGKIAIDGLATTWGVKASEVAKWNRGHPFKMNEPWHVDFTGSTFDELLDHADTTILKAKVKEYTVALIECEKVLFRTAPVQHKSRFAIDVSGLLF